MIGITSNNGVYERFKELPSPILLKCVCNAIQFAGSHTYAEYLARNVVFLIAETNKWFTHCCAKLAEYGSNTNLPMVAQVRQYTC